MEIPPPLISLLRTCRNAAALTGAGVSQESGVPTFRDSLDGLWAKYRAEDLATHQAFRRDPQLVWDWYAMRRAKVDEVNPNPGHTALAEMSRHIPHFTLITQNVDGLHQQAGSPQVIELHGNIRRVKCFRCGRMASSWTDTGPGVPTCSSCGGLLRPDVVWFGEGLPEEAVQAAERASRQCQVFLSIGTSGVVYPAADLAYVAQRHGATIVEINTGDTPLSPHVHFHLRGPSGVVLPTLVAAAWG